MKTSQADILIVPGYKGANEDHWQSRWERNLTSARRVQMGDWHKPVFEDWKANLKAAVSETTKPVILVGHSIGSQVIVNAAAEFDKHYRRGHSGRAARRGEPGNQAQTFNDLRAGQPRAASLPLHHNRQPQRSFLRL